MENAKKNFRKTEKVTILAGIAIALIFLLLWPLTGNYEYEGLIGYFIGMTSVIVFAEGFFLIEKKPYVYLIGFLFFINIKLVIIATLIYLLHKAGISAVHVIIGALTSQTLATITLLFTQHASHQAISSEKENNEATIKSKANT